MPRHIAGAAYQLRAAAADSDHDHGTAPSNPTYLTPIEGCCHRDEDSSTPSCNFHPLGTSHFESCCRHTPPTVPLRQSPYLPSPCTGCGKSLQVILCFSANQPPRTTLHSASPLYLSISAWHVAVILFRAPIYHAWGLNPRLRRRENLRNLAHQLHQHCLDLVVPVLIGAFLTGGVDQDGLMLSPCQSDTGAGAGALGVLGCRRNSCLGGAGETPQGRVSGLEGTNPFLLEGAVVSVEFGGILFLLPLPEWPRKMWMCTVPRCLPWISRVGEEVVLIGRRLTG